jgi:hypothetical protein
MKYLFLILIAFSFASCGGRSYSYLADPIIASYGKEMKNKRGYWVTGTGGSMPCNDVRSIYIMFDGIYEVDIPQARCLFVEVVEGLVKKMNEDKAIRPFLHDYPVTYKNTRILLSFYDHYYDPVSEKYIGFVSCVNDKIYYRIYNKKTRQYDNIFNEPYEEALKIVQEEQKS